MEKNRNIQYVAGIVIIISVFVIVFVKRQSEAPSFSHKLPRFKVLDVRGNIIKNDDFEGKYTYIQFLDEKDKRDISLFKEVYNKWNKEDISFFLIVKNYSKFKNKTDIDQDQIVISEEFDMFSALFNPRDLFGSFYFIINEKRNVIDWGSTSSGYENGPKLFLKEFLKNEVFQISNIIKPNVNINELEWLNQLSDIVKNNDKEYYVFSLFTKICNACPSGAYANTLDRLYALNNKSIYAALILNNRFNYQDINNLKSQIYIKMPIFIAGPELSEKWNLLIQKFREAELTNIIFIVNKEGTILKVLWKDCNCSKKFMSYLESIYGG